MGGIHYKCDKADPLKDLTRVSSFVSAAVCFIQWLREREVDISAYLRKMATMCILHSSARRGKINYASMHPAFSPSSSASLIHKVHNLHENSYQILQTHPPRWTSLAFFSHAGGSSTCFQVSDAVLICGMLHYSIKSSKCVHIIHNFTIPVPVVSLKHLGERFAALETFKTSANQSMTHKRMTMARKQMWLTTLAPEVTCNPGDILQHVLEKYVGDGARYILYYLLQSLGSLWGHYWISQF